MYGIINKTNVQNVKNTMLDTLLSSIAPHLCYDCGGVGAILCHYCKYNIIDTRFEGCLLCARPAGMKGTCGEHTVFYSRAWCVGERSSVLKRIIDDYKFQGLYGAYRPLAELLAKITPILPADCLVVPIPTSAPHIRQRGYDHTLLLAREFARIKNISIRHCLGRKASFVQTGHTRKDRLAQAEKMFSLRQDCKDKIVIIVDDIVTTGASMNAAARVLRDAGARDVWVGALARQPLD